MPDVQFDDQGIARQQFVADEGSAITRFMVAKGLARDASSANRLLLVLALVAVVVAIGTAVAFSSSDRDNPVSEAEKARLLQVMPADRPPVEF